MPRFVNNRKPARRNDIKKLRRAGDKKGKKINRLVTRMDTAEGKSSYIDPTTQTLLSAEITTTNGEVTALQGRATVLEATYTDTQVNTQITTQINSLIDAAPGALNTLNELAAAMGDDAAFSTTVTNSIALKRNISDSYTKTQVDDANTAQNTNISSNANGISGNDNDIAAINTILGSRSASNLASLDTTSSISTQLAAKGTGSQQSTNTSAIAANLAAIQSNDTDIGLRAVIAGPTFTGTVGGISKSMVGLSNVNNVASYSTTQADTANDVITAAQLVITNLLDGRLDTAEAKTSYTDPTTQSLLTAETSSRTSADTAITAAQLVITNALAARLNTAEAKTSYTDPTTQTLLTAETSSRTGADTAITAAQLVITNAITAAQLVITNAIAARATALEATYTDSQVDTEITSAINNLIDSAPGALNTLNELADAIGDDANYAVTVTNALGGKQATIGDGDLTIARTDGLQAALDAKMSSSTTVISGAQASAITANTAKTGISGAQASAITANTSKVTYDAQSAVSANTAKTGITSGQASAITSNTSKVTYDAQSAVSANTAKRNNSAQDTLFDLKAGLATNDQVWTGRQIFGNGSVDARLTLTSNSGGANSLLIMNSRNDDNSCGIYMRHGGTNKFQIKLNGNSDLVFRNMATSQDIITLPTGGNLTLTGNINDITPTELGYLDGVTSNIQTQLDASGGGGWNPTFEIEGTDFTAIRSQGSRPYPTFEIGKNYYFGETTGGTAYMRVPEYNTATIGTYFTVYNGINNHIYVGTYDYGEDGSTSTDQKMHAEIVSGGGGSLASITKDRRTNCVMLAKRESGVERWVCLHMQ